MKILRRIEWDVDLILAGLVIALFVTALLARPVWLRGGALFSCMGCGIYLWVRDSIEEGPARYWAMAWPACWFAAFAVPFTGIEKLIPCDQLWLVFWLFVGGVVCLFISAFIQEFEAEQARLREFEAARQYGPENVYGKSEFVDDEQLWRNHF